MEKWMIIAIVIVCALIALYILYLVASNRRFHRMCDPQIEKLRRYEEARHRSVHAPTQGINGSAGEDIPPIPAPQSYEAKEAPDYTWKKYK